MARVPDIIGLPPGMTVPAMNDPDKLNKMIRDSMPIMKIYPLEPKVNGGLEYFTVENAWSGELGFTTLLGACGIDPPNTGDHIKVAYQAISPFSETYTNSFGHSSLTEKLTQGVSEGWAEAMFITGGDIDGTIKAIEAKGGAIGKMIGSTAKQGGQLARDILGDKIVDMAKDVIEGGKIDFPQIWKSSSWDPSYDISVRLFNPDTAHDTPYEDYCVASLAALMLFATPRSKDGQLWRWPFLCRIDVPGQLFLEMAYCQSITVVKGGDDNTVGWNNRSGMIDVKMSFGSLYNVLVASTNNNGTNKPRLCNYLQNLMGSKKLEGDYDTGVSSGTITAPGTLTASNTNTPTANNATTARNNVTSTENTAAANALNSVA